MNCSECRGRCCSFLVLPPLTTLAHLRTVGEPIRPGMALYVALHRGVRIVHGRLILDADTPVVPYEGRLGKMWLAAAPCSWLEHGRCANYEHRPEVCRRFDETTAAEYIVPRGCWCDPAGKLGENVDEIIELSEEIQHGSVCQQVTS